MLLKERAFRRGRIMLASGRESDFYFDMKPAMLDPDGAALLAELILQELQGVKADCVGGLEMGAVPLIAPVAMKSPEFGRHLPGFFVRKAVKDHGTKKRVDGTDIAGKSVVILEDVTTTGGSAMDAVKAVTEAGAKVALVLVDPRSRRGRRRPLCGSRHPVQIAVPRRGVSRCRLAPRLAQQAVAQVLELVKARVADAQFALLALALSLDLDTKAERLAAAPTRPRVCRRPCGRLSRFGLATRVP